MLARQVSGLTTFIRKSSIAARGCCCWRDAREACGLHNTADASGPPAANVLRHSNDSFCTRNRASCSCVGPAVVPCCVLPLLRCDALTAAAAAAAAAAADSNELDPAHSTATSKIPLGDILCLLGSMHCFVKDSMEQCLRALRMLIWFGGAADEFAPGPPACIAHCFHVVQPTALQLLRPEQQGSEL